MSMEENKAIVRRYQEIYNSNDLDAVMSVDVLTPKIVPGMPQGLEGAKAIHRLAIAGMTNFHTDIQDLVAEEDKVVARVLITGIHTGDFFGIPATGKPVEFSGMYMVRIRDEKIVEHWARKTA